MEIKHKKEQLSMNRDALVTLAECSKLLAAGQPLDQALQGLVEALGETFGADVVLLYRAQMEMSGLPVTPFVWGALRYPQMLTVSSAPKSTAARLMRRKSPFYAPDALINWAKYLKLTPEMTAGHFIQREGIVSSAGVPLWAGQRCLGVLFINFRRSFSFSPLERSLIALFAAQVTEAIRGAQLLEQERRTVRQISMAISSDTSQEEAAGKILEELGKVVGYQKATMQLVQGDNRTLLAFRGFGSAEIDPELLRPISKDNLISRVVAGDRPLILEDPLADPDWEVRPYTRNVISWVGVPLRFAGRLVGLITLDHDQPGFYTPAIEEVLSWFADQAAIAVENARLHNAAQHRIRDLRILNEIGEIMGSQLNTHDLLTVIARRIREHLHCTHCTVFFPKTVDSKILLAPEVVEGKEAERILSRTFKPGEGLVGYVFRTGEALVLPDARDHPHFSPARQRSDAPRSMMVVPVQVGGRMVGVISADQDTYGAFNDSDLRLLQALARQAGIAIQRNRGLELLGEVGRRINSAEDVDEILKLIVEVAIELSHVTSGVIYLVSPDAQHITKSYKYPKQSFHPKPRMDRADGLTRQMISTGQMLKLVDVPGDERVNPVLRKRVQSMIALPLIHEEHVTGVLFLNDRFKHDFTETEISLLSTLAGQAATALYKADLVTGLARQVHMHQILNAVGLKLIDLHDEGQILGAVARSAVQALSCRHCSVFRVEQDNLVVVATHGKLQDQLPTGRIFPMEQGVAGWVAQTGQAALVPDTETDERFDRTWTTPLSRSLVITPIILDEKVYGVISAEDPYPFFFDEQDLRLLQTFSLQVSQALRNARRITELEALNQAGHDITRELKQEAWLDTLLETVKQTLDGASATLFVNEDGSLVARARKGTSLHELEAVRYPVGRGLAGWVAKQRRSLNVPDVRKDQRFLLPSSIPFDSPHSILLAPMVFKDRLIGVISVDKEVVDGFSKGDQRLLETLAAQAATAYENARLFQESRQQASELALLHDVSTRLMTLNLNDLLDMILEGAMSLTNTEVGVIYLLSEDGKRITQSLSKPANFSPATFDLSSSGWTWHIFNTGKPVIISDVDQDQQVSSQVRAMGIRSFIGHPLKVNERVIGVLYLNDSEPHDFSPAELSLSATLASQAATAIENARLFAQDEKNANALRRIVQIVRTIGAGQDPLPVILDEAIHLFQVANYGTFALVEPEAERLVNQVIFDGGSILYGDQIPPDQIISDCNIGIIGYVSRKGSAYRTGNVDKDPLYKCWHTATVSEMVVPLKSGDGQVIGILNLESAERDAFSQADMELCQDLANVAAIALEKGRLYLDLERRVSHLDALSQLARQVGGLPVQQEIFETVVQAAHRTLNASRCTLFVFSGKGLLVPQATSGIPLDAAKELSFRPGEGLAGWVAQEGRAFLTPDANNEPRFLPDRISQPGSPRPMLLAPLWVEGKVTGVLSIDRDGGTPFDQDDLRFLEILAVEAGIFLLRRQRLEEIYHRRFNPYIVGSPIIEPGKFYGRHNLIRFILDGIHNNNFIVYGERRIGKTSLLFQLEYHLNQLSMSDEDFFFVPVLASLQGVAEEHFFGFLTQKIKSATFIDPPAPLGDTYDHSDLQGYLEHVIPALSKQHPGREVRLVLLLDELDVFMDFDNLIHERFRNLFMTRCGESLRMIAACLTVQRVQTRTSPWFNLSSLVEMLPLSADEARDLVTKPIAGYYGYEVDALETLLKTSNCKPMDLQNLAYHSVNFMLNRTLPVSGDPGPSPSSFRIEKQDVEQAIDQVLQKKDTEYCDFWAKLDEKQQQILRAAAQADGWLDGTLLTPREQFYNMTYMEQNHLRLTQLFEMWLKRKKL